MCRTSWRQRCDLYVQPRTINEADPTPATPATHTAAHTMALSLSFNLSPLHYTRFVSTHAARRTHPNLTPVPLVCVATRANSAGLSSTRGASATNYLPAVGKVSSTKQCAR
ncbi:uncharacterized protein LOC105701764 [Orussus abietinus]|uniref:uncharacterized protein LOC105701764 n=1 Tax=Orussus abietinus TaxID=222816 RepID=UPI0006261148|nr:uncharacterized protein LOC105701764 [Orussus abietinus]